MGNGLPFLMFSSNSYFNTKELRAIHRNLGHPSLYKQMMIIEQANIDDLPKNTRKYKDCQELPSMSNQQTEAKSLSDCIRVLQPYFSNHNILA